MNPCPWGQEIYNFGRGFHAHHYFISLSALWPGHFKEIIQFHSMTKIAMP